MKTKRGTQMKNKRPFFRMKKSDNRGIHVKGKWKAVDLDPSLFSDEGMDGLVCFEELTEYSLVDSDKVAANALKQEKKDRKRKSSEVEEGEGESDATKTAEKPAKKKNKKRQVSRDAKHESMPVDNADQNNQVSIKNEGTEEGSPNETSTEDSATCSQIDVESKSVMEQKKIDKNKNRKKNQKKKQQAAKERMLGTVPKSTVDANVLEKEQPSKKGGKPPKNKAKNWTNAGLSCSSDQNTDMDAWKDLFVPAPVLKALSCLGFGSPTPIQALALPPAIRDHMDILGAAETGSGKTLSFAIPMIHTILEWKKGTPEQDGDQDELTGELETESPATLRSDESVETGNSADLVTRQEHKTEPAGEEDGGEGVTGQDEADVEENVSDDDDLSEVENEDGRIGCVKVIKDVEFDFGNAAEAEDGTIGSQNQPLLGLVLTPTRELAVQVKHHIDAVAKFTDIKTAIIVGGMSQQKQSRMLNRRPEIVIATPGRLWELIRERHPHLLSLRQLKCLVIDEADRMVERGHFAELENLLEMLSTTYFNPKRQMFVFSATLTMAPSVPIRLLQKKKRLVQRNKLEVLMEKIGITSKPKVIDLTRKEATVETLTETQIHCAKDEKDFFLYYFLLQYPGRTMVFANSIDCIKRLNSLLVILDCTPLPLHANMHQKQRLKNLERFAERQSCVLLTTDVAARGLDIPNVQHVIHYQIPRTSETYVHRSGRTARATKEGLSLLLTSPEDMLNFKKIYRSLGKDEELPIFPIQTKCMEAIKERVNLARQIEKIEFHNSKEKHHNSWFRQAAEALEVDLDDDVLMGRDRDEDDDRQQQRMVKGMKKHLKHLVSQPVFKNEIKTKYPTQMGKLSLPIMPRAGVESAITSVSNQKKKPKKAKRQH